MIYLNVIAKERAILSKTLKLWQLTERASISSVDRPQEADDPL